MDPPLHSPCRKYSQGSSNKMPNCCIIWPPWCWWTRSEPGSRLGAAGQPRAPASPSPLPPPLPAPTFPTPPSRGACRQREGCGLLLSSPLLLFFSGKELEDATPPLRTRFPCSFGVIWANSDLDKQKLTLMGGGEGVKEGKKLLLALKQPKKSNRCPWFRPVLCVRYRSTQSNRQTLLLFYANFV